MVSSKEQLQRKYAWLIGQIGDVEARINYWKRFKLSPNAQAEVTYLKEIRESLKKELKETRSRLLRFL